jgi:hypothetical protein
MLKPGQIVRETLSQKYPTQKRAEELAQVVEQLPSKHEAEFKPQYCQKKSYKIMLKKNLTF